MNSEVVIFWQFLELRFDNEFKARNTDISIVRLKVQIFSINYISRLKRLSIGSSDIKVVSVSKPYNNWLVFCRSFRLLVFENNV